MIQVTAQQSKNLQTALIFMQRVPSDCIAEHLRFFRDGPDGTLRNAPTCESPACFGGWCPFIPEFAAQGLTVSDFGTPEMVGSLPRTWEECEPDFQLFGVLGLWRPRHGVSNNQCDNAIPLDSVFTNVDAHLTDHALILARLQWAIDNTEIAA